MSNSEFIHYDDKLIGDITIVVSLRNGLDDIFYDSILIIILSLVQFLVISIAIVFISYRITRPLRKIEKATQAIAMGDYSNEIKITGNEELKSLANSLVIMQNKLKEQRKSLSNKIEKLKEKNIVISQNHDEIEVLYQQISAMNQELEDWVIKIKDDYKATVTALANAIEASDMYTRGHCDRVRKYSLAMADLLGVNEEDKEILEYASVLHDIGKIGIPISILNKKETLKPEEYELLKKHSEIGYEIIKDVPFLREVADVILHHHERIVGNGYPSGISDSEISTLSKILAVADAYDAMTSRRPYREIPLTSELAIKELIRYTDVFYDRKVVESLLKVLDYEE